MLCRLVLSQTPVDQSGSSAQLWSEVPEEGVSEVASLGHGALADDAAVVGTLHLTSK